jgi:hypothetical protein
MEELEPDLFPSHRVTLKKRYNLLLTQQAGMSNLSLETLLSQKYRKLTYYRSDATVKKA